MTSSDIRQSFLDFFKSKQHTIVPSSSLMPDSPNLLFTNAGMNQFVPIFLGQVKCPYQPPRAADTQKCIRAGGKHNDLDDVGLDTYHHTFFEMLGNWSFGDYFKREAIDWAWELVTEIWKFPKNRLYATVYSPDKSKGDPSDFDQEAYDFWAAKFTAAGLDPKVHIVYGNKKDNFWMMGETGPCGPCSELHVDLTPLGDTKGALVNQGDARCMEIWNLVFIQFNANADGTFSPLPARHVDTGMGFERATSIIQCTKKFTDFTGVISNYETDIFRPIFDRLEKMSGKKYGSTLPTLPGSAGVPPATVGVSPAETAVHVTQGSAGVPPATVGVSPAETAVHVTQGSAGVPPATVGVSPAETAVHVTQGSAGVPPAAVGVSPAEPIAPTALGNDRNERTPGVGATYYKRRLPHFERPWAKYMVTFTTHDHRQLSAQARDIVLKSLLYGHEHCRYQLYAACVMPDHVHMLLEPQIKEENNEGKPVFWSLTELFHSIKSFTAHEINKLEGRSGQIWENESFDRLIRGDADLEEKFHYICRNPWDAGVVSISEEYPWLWTPNTPVPGSAGVPPATVGVSPTETVARDAQRSDRDGRAPHSAEQLQIDVAFRVIADHIRTLSFAIADGIQPGNTDRNYVLRRILRRAVRYGRTLGFHNPFFYKLVDVLAETMGHVFPEIRDKKQHVQEVIQTEEEAFNKTLDRGMTLFEQEDGPSVIIQTALIAQPVYPTPAAPKYSHNASMINGILVDYPQARRHLAYLLAQAGAVKNEISEDLVQGKARHSLGEVAESIRDIAANAEMWTSLEKQLRKSISAQKAFELYDTYGFPLDLTELMARERGLTVDVEGFNEYMERQRARGRAAQKKEVISLSEIETITPTKFVGYENLEVQAKVLEVVSVKEKTAVILDVSAAYAEMGGQVGDTGELTGAGQLWRIANTQKTGNTWLHIIGDAGNADEGVNRKSQIANSTDIPAVGSSVTLAVDKNRRHAIERHHTVTHLLHWALHEVVNKEASQKGSFVGQDKLTFDFNNAPLTPQQVADIEKLVNERILENAGVSWTEVPHADVKSRKDVMQFFGDKYGDTVRVVQIGGHAAKLDGYSMELCGGTHTRATGEIGLFRIVSENAVAAGVRRIEAVAGLEAYRRANDELHLIKNLAGKVNSPVHELDKKIESLLAQQKELEKSLRAANQKEAAGRAKALLARAETINGIPVIIANIHAADGDTLQIIADILKGQFKGVVVLGAASNGAVSLVAAVSPEFTGKAHAGKIIQAIAPIVGGKGGGKPDNARGGGKDTAKLDEALAKAKTVIIT